jgi:pyruvate/2-oxoglutarate dehydrogenase complex dihydrolipoamide acyltransferase (E2) component
MRQFLLPDLGEGLEEAEIVAWHVTEGDHVVADQPLVSVDTDKAVMEVPSPRGGRIARLFGAKGDLVKVGAPLVQCRRAQRARSACRARPHARRREGTLDSARRAAGRDHYTIQFRNDRRTLCQPRRCSAPSGYRRRRPYRCTSDGAPRSTRGTPGLALSLTFDHRVVTGGEATRFLVALKLDLEEPS